MKKLDENWQPLGSIIKRLADEIEARKAEEKRRRPKLHAKLEPAEAAEGEV